MSSSLPTMQQQLRFLVQSTPELWAYIIFWRKTEDANGRLVLTWEDGDLLENNDVAVSKQPQFDYTLNESTGEAVDLKLFYMVSCIQSFSIGEDVIGEVYGSRIPVWLSGVQEYQRYRQAQMQGIQTFVCIPTESGVIELGSSELYRENRGLIEKAKSLFCYNAKTQGGKLGLSSSWNSECSSSSDVRKSEKGGKNRGNGVPIAVNHVEGERERREKLNIRFYALRAAVPIVSGMDKASLLADATKYITELKSKISWLQSEKIGIEVDVKIFGQDVVIRVRCKNINHPSARVMAAIRDLDFHVHQASVSVVEDVMLHHIVASLPVGSWSKEHVKDELMSRLV